jgi:hypothetical protein
MTFKDLKKRIRSSNQQQTQSFDKLQNKPFWIWNIEEHKLEDVRTKGECCFNHIIGLPTKEGLEKPIFDYQELLYEALLSPGFCNPLNHDFKDKHLWIKKATGLGVTEFFLRFMAWLCLMNDNYRNSQMCIVHSTSMTSSTIVVIDNTVKLGINLRTHWRHSKKRKDMSTTSTRSLNSNKSIEAVLSSAASSSSSSSKDNRGDTLLTKKIVLATEVFTTSKYCELVLRDRNRLSKENALVICDYIIAMKREINPRLATIRTTIQFLSELSKSVGIEKRFEDMTREDDVLSHLDSCRKPENDDPLHNLKK